MGFDVGEWTVRVLEGGLPPLPDRLEPGGQTVPLALWRGERYGAVVFVRLWKNGQPDYDCAITERAGDGSWQEPGGWGGSAWIEDPLVRPGEGWDGDPVAWLGTSAMSLDADDEWDEATSLGESAAAESDAVFDRVDELMVQSDVRAIVGAASQKVAAIEVERAGRSWTVPVESSCGAFIVGIEGPGVATLRPLGHDGRPLPDADGATERTA
jgi:hypothetical protein